MKFLFAGCGSIGRRHIANLKALEPSCEILAYRVRGEPLGDFGKRHRIRETKDLDTALDEKPDAIFVTNPTSMHLNVAMKAALRGIPLFIEKPLSHNFREIKEFIAVCKKKKVLVVVGYKMRFHPSIITIKRLVEKDAVGRVLAAKAQYGGYLPDWHPWEDYRRMYSAQKKMGGGIIFDAIHELDYLMWILGPVKRKSVKAMGGHISALEIDSEDVAEMLLEFECGAVGNVHLNYVQRPEYRSCQIIGEKGTIFWDSLRKSVDLYDGEKKAWENYPEPKNFNSNDMFLDELRDFLKCLKEDGEKKPITIAEAYAHQISLIAQKQCEKGSLAEAMKRQMQLKMQGKR